MTSHPATTTGGPVHQVLARLRPRDRMLIRLLGGHQVLSADRIYDDAPPRCVQPGRLVLILLDQPEHEQQLHHMPSFSSLRPVATTVPTRHGDGPAGAIWRQAGDHHLVALHQLPGTDVDLGEDWTGPHHLEVPQPEHDPDTAAWQQAMTGRPHRAGEAA